MKKQITHRKKIYAKVLKNRLKNSNTRTQWKKIPTPNNENTRIDDEIP